MADERFPDPYAVHPNPVNPIKGDDYRSQNQVPPKVDHNITSDGKYYIGTAVYPAVANAYHLVWYITAQPDGQREVTRYIEVRPEQRDGGVRGVRQAIGGTLAQLNPNPRRSPFRVSLKERQNSPHGRIRVNLTGYEYGDIFQQLGKFGVTRKTVFYSTDKWADAEARFKHLEKCFSQHSAYSYMAVDANSNSVASVCGQRILPSVNLGKEYDGRFDYDHLSIRVKCSPFLGHPSWNFRG